jgi:hypothetical protein
MACYGPVHVFLHSANVKQMFYNFTGNWREISTLFKPFLHFGSRYLCSTTSDKISANLLIVNCLTKFLILAVKGLTNSLLQQAIWLHTTSNLAAYGLYNIAYRNTYFLPKNCLTEVYTFHMSFETYCPYNSMEKYAFFAGQLFERGLNFSQVFLSFLPVWRDKRFLSNNCLTVV